MFDKFDKDFSIEGYMSALVTLCVDGSFLHNSFFLKDKSCNLDWYFLSTLTEEEIKNLQMNKVYQIVKEIGKQPVLSFGNSSGDFSMHMHTITGNKYKSEAFMLIADDEDRDYGNTAKNTKLGENWKSNGFNVISMKNDFKTIYGYDVQKTKLTYTF